MPLHSSCPHDLCRRVNYWQSREPLAPMISKLDQKGFKALTDYTEQRDLCTTREVFFFFCITALGVGKKIPLWPHRLLLLSLHPHTLPPPRDGGITCITAGGKCPPDRGNMHTHLWCRNVCVVSNRDIINYLAKGFFYKRTLLSVKEYLMFSSAEFQIFVNT